MKEVILFQSDLYNQNENDDDYELRDEMLRACSKSFYEYRNKSEN